MIKVISRGTKTKFNKPGFAPLIVLIIVAALVGVGLLGYKLSTTQKQQKKVPTVSQNVKKVPPRSKAPGVVLGAMTAHGYNPKTGAAIGPDKYFSAKDPKLYLLMKTDKPKPGTRIEYVRYLQGRYLDHRAIQVTQPNWKYAYFAWSSKLGKLHRKGIYRVRVYTNGVLEKKVNYEVR